MTLAKPKKSFIGKPCRKCGGTERYSANANCVWCQKTRIKGKSLYMQPTEPANPLMTAYLAGRLPIAQQA